MSGISAFHNAIPFHGYYISLRHFIALFILHRAIPLRFFNNNTIPFHSVLFITLSLYPYYPLFKFRRPDENKRPDETNRVLQIKGIGKKFIVIWKKFS